MVGMSSIPQAEALTTMMGIGGYFLITRVENIIETGMFETGLTCVWVTSGFLPKDESSGQTDPCAQQGSVNIRGDYGSGS